MPDNDQTLPPDHDPDTCDGSCGVLHDNMYVEIAAFLRETAAGVPSTAGCIAEILTEPISEPLSKVVELVDALRQGTPAGAAQAGLLVIELMEDEADYQVYSMIIEAGHLLAAICNDQDVPTEQFRKYAQVAMSRTGRPGGG